jgi:hypothetical protein
MIDRSADFFTADMQRTHERQPAKFDPNVIHFFGKIDTVKIVGAY